MTITFVQRSLIIFAVLLCYYQSWVGAVNCEDEPYHPSCRGSQARKRLVPLPVMRAINCEEGDCRFPRMKFLIAILDDTPYRNNEVHPSNSEANSVHSRKNRLRVEDSKDAYLDDY
ncbi:uncharacterized protein LOC112459932 [Temnothorax curvispinosus]|uniref:Uncharacterized protein LOC112459932 n=1 Tax=Temnothorax curvispinosus TaxID=300111 RepID=A0A6J1QE85_9HYME|nr:uncharacterized protein LOC112459932 [Temnothorax curvispinosus]